MVHPGVKPQLLLKTKQFFKIFKNEFQAGDNWESVHLRGDMDHLQTIKATQEKTTRDYTTRIEVFALHIRDKKKKWNRLKDDTKSLI